MVNRGKQIRKGNLFKLCLPVSSAGTETKYYNCTYLKKVKEFGNGPKEYRIFQRPRTADADGVHTIKVEDTDYKFDFIYASTAYDEYLSTCKILPQEDSEMVQPYVEKLAAVLILDSDYEDAFDKFEFDEEMEKLREAGVVPPEQKDEMGKEIEKLREEVKQANEKKEKKCPKTWERVSFEMFSGKEEDLIYWGSETARHAEAGEKAGAKSEDIVTKLLAEGIPPAVKKKIDDLSEITIENFLQKVVKAVVPGATAYYFEKQWESAETQEIS